MISIIKALKITANHVIFILQTFEWISISMILKYQVDKTARDIHLNKITTSTKNKNKNVNNKNFFRTEHKVMKCMRVFKYLFLVLDLALIFYYNLTLTFQSAVWRITTNGVL